jgi:hypothetical protein
MGYLTQTVYTNKSHFSNYGITTINFLSCFYLIETTKQFWCCKHPSVCVWIWCRNYSVTCFVCVCDKFCLRNVPLSRIFTIAFINHSVCFTSCCTLSDGEWVIKCLCIIGNCYDCLIVVGKLEKQQQLPHVSTITS